MDYSIIIKHLAGEASSEETAELFQWIGADPANRNEFAACKKAWALTSQTSEDPGTAWQQLSATILPGKKPKSFSIRPWMAVAGFLLLFALGMATGLLVRQGSPSRQAYAGDTRLDVPLGQMSNVTLPDGTVVRMNSGTRLKYSNTYRSGDRTIFLEGEAFFDVVKDSSHPFIIRTGAVDFRVYGTSFNVQAYPGDKLTNATLVEGSMGVVGKNGVEMARLVPGQNAAFNGAEGKLEVSKVSLNLYTSWKDGLITFSNEKLKDIAKKIERWYNVEIIIKNEKLGNEPYMGTIMKNKPVDQILQVFSLTSSLRYKIIPRADKPSLIYWE